jgi:hypothetical protein
MRDSTDMTPNVRAERRARRRLGLALYPSRVLSSDLLGNILSYGSGLVTTTVYPSGSRIQHSQFPFSLRWRSLIVVTFMSAARRTAASKSASSNHNRTPLPYGRSSGSPSGPWPCSTSHLCSCRMS